MPVYPELTSLVGSWVPDYRGDFLRGVGRKSVALGQFQGDAMQRITGGIRTASQKMDGVGEILWVFITLPQRGEGVMFTGQEIMRGCTRIQFLIRAESSGLWMKPVL